MVPQKLQIAVAIVDPKEASQTEELLNADGYEVISFHSAQEAWKSFERFRPRFLITDRRFNDNFSGLDLSRNIRNRYSLPFVYILMLSRLDHINEIDEGLDAGINDYLIKPFNHFQIRARVCSGLRWLQYIDSITLGEKTNKHRNQAESNSPARTNA